MKLHYKISEQTGTFGGRSFIASVRVELNEAENKVRTDYGIHERIDLGERFKEVKGVDVLGHISLRDVLNQSKDYKFSSIQMASDFVANIKTGLKYVKDQIDGTASSIRRLNQSFETEIE